MSVTYTSAEDEVAPILEHVLMAYHPDLERADVTFDLVFAHPDEDANGEPKGPALKKHGVAAEAIVRIVSLKDRAKKNADVEICFDAAVWKDKSPSEREALVDHEVTHVVLRIGKDGELMRDDLNRPKLRMRPHDREFGWFDEVARRHGKSSGEVQQAAVLMSNHDVKQSYFPWIFADELAPA